MTSNDNTQELHLPVQSRDTGPGELLARKREALGMTVQEVADELRITKYYVHSLEENAFDRLPGDVFVRGYIRAYAVLLKLDPQVLINVFNEYAHKQGVEHEIFATLTRRRGNRNQPWIIVSGVAFVAIAIALWYFNSGVPAPTPTPGSAAGQSQSSGRTANSTIQNANAGDRFPAVAPSAVSPATNTSTTAPAVTPNLLTPDSAITTDRAQQLPGATPGTLTQPTQSAPTQSAPPQSAPPQSAPPQSAPALTPPAQGLPTQNLPTQSQITPTQNQSTPGAPVQTAPVPTDAAPATAPAGPAPTGTPRQQPTQETPVDDVARVINVDAGGEDVVQIIFKGNSFVEVDDGNDKQIYSDTQKAGDVVLINGSAPFEILLGDASTTELRLNGSRVDFSSSIRIDNSARLTIGF